MANFQIGDKVVAFGPTKGIVMSQVYQEQETRDFCCLVDLENIGVVVCSVTALSPDKETNMEQVIEQGNYYRVVERNGKYYPEYQDFRGSDNWHPMEEVDGSVACFENMEEVEQYWQRREF